ncbi:MAG: cytochrome c [Rhodospirillales bacterium]|nr:cytochrome c [Rhodospirillales bacterium]
MLFGRYFLFLTVFVGLIVYLALPYMWTSSQERSFETIKGDPERGKYVIRVAGCVACHTDSKNGGKFLAGGYKMQTPFGVFITPNITPDKTSGIGGWDLKTFSKALTQGISPEGSHYFPSFPYNAYSKMTTQDVADLKAYLDSVTPVKTQVVDHDLTFPFNQRRGLTLWKWLYFDESPLKGNSNKSEAWNRGAYIVNGPGHCGECHTPRTLFGGLETSNHLSGVSKSFAREKIPNITNAPETGIGKWSESDLSFLLQVGMKPDGDFVSGSMGLYVREGTGMLTPADRKAIITYLLDN